MAIVACLACGSIRAEPWAVGWDAEYLTTTDRFSLYRCLECDSLFIDPVPSDRLAQIYPSNYYSFAPPGHSVVHRLKQRLDRRLLRRVLSMIPGDRLAALDIGGGSGWLLRLVRAADSRVGRTVVVDFDRGAESAAKRSGHEYFCGRIEDFESNDRFDLVLLLNLIEHVAEPLAVLRKIRNLLSPAGLALLKTPNHDSLDARLFRHANWAGYHCPRHWVLFTERSLTALADRAGLEVREFSYTQGAPFWATSIIFWMASHGLATVTPERPAVYHPLYAPLSAIFAGVDFMRRPLAKTSQMFFVLGRKTTAPK